MGDGQGPPAFSSLRDGVVELKCTPPSMNHRNDPRPPHLDGQENVLPLPLRYLGALRLPKSPVYSFVFGDHTFIKTGALKASLIFLGVPVENYNVARSRESYGGSNGWKVVMSVVGSMDEVEEGTKVHFSPSKS